MAKIASKIFNWGIMGSGGIANDFTLALRSVPQASAVAVATSNSHERAQKFADKHGIANAYGSYDSLLKDDNVEIVYIGTLNTTHCELVIKSLKAGKHVLCEKPMGVNDREVKEMVKCARQEKKFLMEAMWTRFFPAMKRVREILKEGVIGKVKQVDAGFGVEIPRNVTRVWEREHAGGGLLDLGVYPLYFASMCYSYDGLVAPTGVQASGKLSEKGIDIWTNITMDYTKEEEKGGTEEKDEIIDGRHALVSCNLAVRTPESWVVSGTKGNIRVHMNAHSPKELTVTLWGTDRQAEPKVDDLKFEGGLPMLSHPPQPISYVYPGSEGLCFQALAVQDAIGSGKLECVEMSLDESLVMATVMSDVRKQIGVKFPQDTIPSL